MTQTNRLSAWVTSTRQTVPLGTANSKYFARAHVHVTELFNSDGTDLITIGYATDTDAYVTSVDVSSTGVKSVTLGVLSGYIGTAHPVVAYYTAGGSAPTTGKAYICLELWPAPAEPS